MTQIKMVVLLTCLSSNLVYSFRLENENHPSRTPTLENAEQPQSHFPEGSVPNVAHPNAKDSFGTNRKSRQMPFIIYGGCSANSGFGYGARSSPNAGDIPEHLRWCYQRFGNDCLKILRMCQLDSYCRSRECAQGDTDCAIHVLQLYSGYTSERLFGPYQFYPFR